MSVESEKKFMLGVLVVVIIFMILMMYYFADLYFMHQAALTLINESCCECGLLL